MRDGIIDAHGKITIGALVKIDGQASPSGCAG